MKVTKKHDDGCTYFHDLAQGDVFSIKIMHI